MLKVQQYPIEARTVQVVEVPTGFQVLCVKDETKFSPPCLYLVIDDMERTIPITIFTVWTGFGLDASTMRTAEYLGTVLTDTGLSVWHLFLNRGV